MVPRVRVVGIPLGTTPDQIRAAARPHAAHPLSDLRARSRSHHRHGSHQGPAARAARRTNPFAATHARPLPLVPETAPLDSVLSTMRRERTQMVIVIDEHGGTAGVVTLQDLFEEVVGEIEEGPATPPQVYRDASGRLRVPGTMRLDELGQEFDLDLEHEDVDSVSGLVLTLLGRPPAVGDTVHYERLQFEVTARQGTRRRRVRRVAGSERAP